MTEGCKQVLQEGQGGPKALNPQAFSRGFALQPMLNEVRQLGGGRDVRAEGVHGRSALFRGVTGGLHLQQQQQRWGK